MAAFVVFAGLFLLLLATLAYALVKLFTRRDAEGKARAPGCIGGCFLVFLLLLLGAAGIATFIAGVVVVRHRMAASHIDRAFPRLRLPRVETTPRRDFGEFPLHVMLEWHGHSEPTDELIDAVREAGASDDMRVTADYEFDELHEKVTRVDVGVRSCSVPTEEFERKLREGLAELSTDEQREIEIVRIDELR